VRVVSGIGGVVGAADLLECVVALSGHTELRLWKEEKKEKEEMKIKKKKKKERRRKQFVQTDNQPLTWA
jgi:Na+-transporting methylmalonyl-CoA/oxaloacetate decarboxylase gamma subunit